jgi:hypothetical protein
MIGHFFSCEAAARSQVHGPFREHRIPHGQILSAPGIIGIIGVIDVIDIIGVIGVIGVIDINGINGINGFIDIMSRLCCLVK